jgi:hypothetical protein
MSTRNIPLANFSSGTRSLINQALQVALNKSASEPVIFQPLNSSYVPTGTEAQHAAEIIKIAMMDQIIYAAAAPFIAEALRYVASDIKEWLDTRDAAQALPDAMIDYFRNNGMYISDTTVTELKCLARNICPIGELNDYIVVDNQECLNDCIDRIVEAREEEARLSIYEPQKIGITVDGTVYAFPADHPVLDALHEMMVDFYSN